MLKVVEQCTQKKNQKRTQAWAWVFATSIQLFFTMHYKKKKKKKEPELRLGSFLDLSPSLGYYNDH
jgi:hypothetical protein